MLLCEDVSTLLFRLGVTLTKGPLPAHSPITGEVLAVFLGQGKIEMEINAIDSKLRNLEAERAKAQAEFDRMRNELQDLRAAKQAELDAQGG